MENDHQTKTQRVTEDDSLKVSVNVGHIHSFSLSSNTFAHTR